MPYPDDFTVAETNQIFRELREIDRQRDQFRATATPQYAQAVGALVQHLPQAEGSLVEPLGRAVADGQMSLEEAQSLGLETQKLVLNDPQTYEKEQPKGGFLSRIQDSVMDVTKFGSRWTFAAANFIPQVVTNLGARAVASTIGASDKPGGTYERPETGFFDGWFASTDIGGMLSGKDYGEGFFIGEDALEYQREQAKRYRGTVGDGGWTFGRGLASTFLQPGSKEYNILSGLVDAGAAIAIPSIPFASQIGKGARVVKNFGAAKAGLKTRSLAGLADFGNAQIIASKVPRWLDSADGLNVTRHLAEEVNTWEDALDTFRNKSVSNEFLDQIINTTDMSEMRTVLNENLGLAGLSSTTDINMRAVDTMMGDLGKWGIGKSVRRTKERLGARVGDNTVYLDFSDEYARNDSIRKVLDTMRTLRVEEYVDMNGATRTREDLLGRLARVVNLQEPEEFANVIDEIDQMIAYGIGQSKRAGRKAIKQAKAQGLPIDEALANANQQAAYSIMRRFRSQQGNQLFGSVAGQHGQGMLFGLGRKTEFGALDEFDDLGEGSGIFIGSPIQDNLLAGKRTLADGTEETGMFMAPDLTAGVLGEEAARAANIPDISALRRETSKIAWMFTSKAKDAGIGDPNKFVTMLDFFQNRVWKTGTLMTGGYAIRNISESMVRSAMAPGIRTGPTHPIEWIMAMTNRRGFGTIDGLKWTDEALTLEASKMMREYAEATGVTMREAMEATSLQYKAYQTGSWAQTNRVANPTLYRQGIKDQIHLLGTDPIVRQLAQGKTNDEIIEWMRTTQEGKGAVRAWQARWSNKRPAGATGKDFDTRVIYDFVGKDGTLNKTNLDKGLDLYLAERLNVETGNFQELKEIVATFIEGGVIRNADGTTTKAFKFGELGGGRTLPGTPELLGYEKAFDDLVDRLVKENPEAFPMDVKYRVHADGAGLTGSRLSDHSQMMKGFNDVTQHFFTSVFGKKEAFLNRSPAFRKFYYKQVENLLSRMDATEAQKIVAKVREGYADELSETYRTLKGLKPLEDGTFQLGSEIVDELEYVSRLNAAKAAREAALESVPDQWARRYLGGGSMKERITKDSLWDDIKARAAGETQPVGATLTAEEVSLASRAYAMEETKKLFYDASERSNLGDIMRIVSPFGSAWAEVMKAWYTQVLRNPNRLKNMSVTFRGVRDMDPDGDGKGFIYTDPVSGEMVFNYPFVPGMSSLIFGAAGGLAAQTVLGRSPLGMAGSGALGVLGGGIAGAKVGATAEQNGISATLSAPVKSANMALNVLPSVGPVIQIAANAILPDKPQYDDLRSFLMPYGTVEPTPGGLAEQITPSWLKKMIEAISADPENDRMFGDMYMDSYKALVASGQFDMNNSDDVIEIEQRAKATARSLLMLRSIGQFVGPARPDVLLNVPTKFEGKITLNDVNYLVEDGNVPNNVLAKVYRMFADQDYDTAVERFIETFGDNTMMYIVGNTTAVSRGLDASKEFGDWERENSDFATVAPNVYGYFADVGSEFDMETYLRQLRTGERERRTDPKEAYREAEAVVGRAMYRHAVTAAGSNPSGPRKEALRNYKVYLREILPGYAFQPYDVQERGRVIAELQQATVYAASKENPSNIAKAASTYFDYREKAIEVANARRGQEAMANPLAGDVNADLRLLLRNVGELLVTRYPEFERMYSRELFNEIDLDA